MELTSIASLCGQPTNRLKKIEYAPINWIDSNKWDALPLAHIKRKMPEDIFVAGKNWLIMPISVKSKSVGNNSDRNAQGVYDSSTLQARLPILNDDIISMLEVMKHGKYLVRVSLSGNKYIIGDLVNHLTFNYDTSINGMTGGGATVTWSGVSPNNIRPSM